MHASVLTILVTLIGLILGGCENRNIDAVPRPDSCAGHYEGQWVKVAGHEGVIDYVWTVRGEVRIRYPGIDRAHFDVPCAKVERADELR